METAELFIYGNSQCVRLPNKYRLNCDEIAVQQLGSSLILTPIDKISNNLLTCKKMILSSTEEFTD